MNQLRDLDRSDCLELLRRVSVGRAAVTTADGPHIVPVNYAVVDDTVAIRTSAYSILGSYGRGSVMAFEVDEIDPVTRGGWSVLVRGRCRVETDPAAIGRVRDALGDSWAAGSRTLYLRLGLEEVSGRALGAVSSAPRSPSPA